MDVKLTKLVRTPGVFGGTLKIEFILLASDGKNTLDLTYSLSPEEVAGAVSDDANLTQVIEQETNILIDRFNEKFGMQPVPVVASQPELDSYSIAIDEKTQTAVVSKSPSLIPIPVQPAPVIIP